jgi:hypothetical protein
MGIDDRLEMERTGTQIRQQLSVHSDSVHIAGEGGHSNKAYFPCVVASRNRESPFSLGNFANRGARLTMETRS